MSGNKDKDVFRLFVKPAKNSIQLLIFIKDHIEEVNDMGARIKIVKLGGSTGDDFTNKICKSAKITRLPTMIMSDGTKVIGKDKIITLIEDNLAKTTTPKMQLASMGCNQDMADYWQAQLYDGVDKTPRRDDDEDEDDIGDIQKRMDAYRRSRPKHHRPPDDDEDEYETVDDNTGRPIRSGGDNIAAPEEARKRMAPGGKGKSVTAMSGDAMDDLMLRAFMDNTADMPT